MKLFTTEQMGEIGLSALLSILLGSMATEDAWSLILGGSAVFIAAGLGYCVYGAVKGEFSFRGGWKL